jgi:hypothetical protein
MLGSSAWVGPTVHGLPSLPPLGKQGFGRLQDATWPLEGDLRVVVTKWKDKDPDQRRHSTLLSYGPSDNLALDQAQQGLRVAATGRNDRASSRSGGDRSDSDNLPNWQSRPPSHQ